MDHSRAVRVRLRPGLSARGRGFEVDFSCSAGAGLSTRGRGLAEDLSIAVGARPSTRCFGFAGDFSIAAGAGPSTRILGFVGDFSGAAGAGLLPWSSARLALTAAGSRLACTRRVGLGFARRLAFCFGACLAGGLVFFGVLIRGAHYFGESRNMPSLYATIVPDTAEAATVSGDARYRLPGPERPL